MSIAPRFALVAAAEARLRTEAFDILGALGYRVDAVGDDLAVGRRLEKDAYDLIVTDTLAIPPVPARTQVVRVEPTLTGGALETRLRATCHHEGGSPGESAQEDPSP